MNIELAELGKKSSTSDAAMDALNQEQRKSGKASTMAAILKLGIGSGIIGLPTAFRKVGYASRICTICGSRYFRLYNPLVFRRKHF